MQTELYYYLTQAVKTRLTCVLSALASLVLLSSVPTVKPELAKVGLLIGAGLSSSVCLLNSGVQKEVEDALEDFRVNTGIKRQRSLLWNTSVKYNQTTEEVDTTGLTLFDLASIGEQRDNFPNVFIIGSPGSGKTTAAEYLGVVLKAGKRYAIHPHAKPTDFRGFDRIFGGGRNIGTPEDEVVSWEDIENRTVNHPTVSQVFTALYGLMNKRYQAYYQGHTDFESIDVYIDELPAIVSGLGRKFISGLIPPLIMECRKVGIRLWFLTQAFQVRALGLEGISDLREGATVIRLGKLAVKECERLARSGSVDQSVLGYLKSTDRPVLVDDEPARLPRFTEMQAAIQVFASVVKDKSTQSITSVNVQTDNLSLPSFGGLTKVDSSATQTDNLSVQILDKQTEDNLTAHVKQLFTTEDYKQTQTNTRQLLRQLKKTNDPRLTEVYILVYQLAESLHSQPSNAIVKQYWGFTAKAYQQGLTIAKELGLREGVK